MSVTHHRPVTLKAEFPNPNICCFGAFVRVRLPQAVAEGVIAVPQRWCFPAREPIRAAGDGGQGMPRPVQSGPAGTDFVIEDGLEGDETSSNGVQKVRPGAVVNLPLTP
jgi:hypothetical protein